MQPAYSKDIEKQMQEVFDRLSEKDRILEDYKYEIKAREQASKVAEYFSYYFRLRPDSNLSNPCAIAPRVNGENY